MEENYTQKTFSSVFDKVKAKNILNWETEHMKVSEESGTNTCDKRCMRIWPI